MKKGIRISTINGVAKKAALGAMLASSVAMFASNPIKTERTDNPPQTEVVSKDGAEALKVMTFPQQQNPAVPTVHNKALDEKCLKFCDTEEEKKHMNDFLSMNYNKYGSYLGSAIIQQNIDLNMFLEFLDGNIDILKRFDEEAYNKIDRDAMQKVVEKGEPIKQWLNENYFKVYNQPFGQFDHPPDAEEVSNALDQFVKTDPYNLFNKDFVEVNYTLPNGRYRRAQEQVSYSDDLQKHTNYISHQVYCADNLLFYNLLKSTKLSSDDLKKAEKCLSAYMLAIMPKL